MTTIMFFIPKQFFNFDFTNLIKNNLMKRTEFNKENMDIIIRIMSDDNTTQQSKYYNLEQLGFLLFDSALGKTKRNCLFIHKNKKDNIVKVQLESGFGRYNYAKYVYLIHN